jgi:hypothetical protein
MESMVEPEQSSDLHLREVLAMIGKALTSYLIETWSSSLPLFPPHSSSPTLRDQ